MTHIQPPDDSEPTALAPDPSRLADRARRAWTERMDAVRSASPRRYAFPRSRLDRTDTALVD